VEQKNRLFDRQPGPPSVTLGPSEGLPSEWVRALVTVALCLYLVGLVLCVAGNSGSGSSALVRNIKSRLFSPWMVPPWLDLGYDYRFTYGQPDDADHRIEVRRRNDTASEKPLLFPSAGMWGERAARWRRLARAAALAEQDPDREGLLPTAVGVGCFDELSAEDVSIRLLRHLPPERADVAAGAPAPRFDRAYAARVRRIGGEVQLLKAEPRGEVAPLVEGPAR
jgi:hypothetical protein